MQKNERKMLQSPLVSVGMLTYNQASYVRQALDGIVLQKTNFSFEVIIGDDASTDGTQEILEEYASHYPNLFTLILRKENIGASKNNYDLKHRASGKYFACLEGDDYWTDENKLQLQVDFLETHPEYIACVHRCRFVDEDGQPLKDQPVNGYYCKKDVFTLKDFERGELPGQTATLMYRNIFLEKDKDFSILYRANPHIGDKTAILLLTSRGDIYNMNRVMSCYRFVRSKDATNVSSGFNGRNHRDELMRYLMNLEEYARSELHIPLDMDKKKRDYFAAAVTVYLKEKSAENRAVVDRMLALTDRKISYRILKWRVCIVKLFGWTVLKRDIRINV